jgi:integrase/recombinase XerD
VTHLRKLTLDEIARRNYTERTTRAYLRIIEDLARYFHRSPDQLGPDQLREYTAHLFRDRKLSDNSVNQIVGALRFFFRKVRKRPWDMDEIPYPKKKIHLPVIWSPEEVTSLIDAAPIPFYRTILMTLYGTGVRRTECAALKLTDIDSARMVVHVHEGKGGKDRDIVLSPNLYQELRGHYRRLARKPAVWLFPGGTHHTADTPITDKVVWHACRESAKRAGVNKPLHPHTLRHYAASRTMPRNQTKEARRPPQRGNSPRTLPSRCGIVRKLNQSCFRNASSSSSGLKRFEVPLTGLVLAKACSFSARSASR